MADRELTQFELSEQQEYIEKCRELVSGRFGPKPLALARTFGCQQNEADTELIRGMLAGMGFSFTDQAGEADLVIFNTCAIREHAEMRAFGNVGETSHMKKADKNRIICLCGCMAQQEHVAARVKDSFPYVDVLFGTHALWRFPRLLFEKLTTGKRVFDTGGEEKIPEGMTPHRNKGVTAWLSVMYGCNNYCSYCVVPYVRGRERSRRPERVLEEFRALVEQGYKDITLLGQNVNSYGNDLALEVDFADLLAKINGIPGDFRVRFMTSHPKDATKKLFDTMAACDKVMNSIHLPVQAGSSRVLEAMNRRYTREKYFELVDYARRVVPGLTMTSDIIVGFPGESEEDFLETLDLLERVRFDSLFTFIFSPRRGTAAWDLEPRVPREVQQDRFDRLLEVQNRTSREINDGYLGKTQRVLVDGFGEDKDYPLSARTEGFKLVHVKGDPALIGGYADVTIDRRSTWALFGEAK